MLAITDDEPLRTTLAGPADHDVERSSNVLGYDAGWHELDPGPLSPRGGASLTWTGTELIVLAGERHHDGAAYNPATRTWRTIADPPWTDAGVVQAAWAGDRLYVLGPDTQATTSPCCQPRRWAVYDPATDEWTERESWTSQDPRDAAQVLIQPPPTLAWTGTQVLRLDTLDVYDPASDDWLTMPDPPEDAPIATAGWTGTEVVLAASDTPTQTYDPKTRAWRVTIETPVDGFVAHAAATAWDGDTLVFADSLGQAAFLDPASGAWSELSSPRANFEACAPTGVMVDRPVFDLCDDLYRLTESGGWERIEGGEGTCCYPTIASTGDVLFQWTSNDDTANNAAAPYTRFRLWIPPGTATVEAPTVTGPDDLEPTGTMCPSPTTGLPTPEPTDSTDPATPSNPADPTMTMPPTTMPPTTLPPTTLPPTSAPPSSTDTAAFPWEWYDLPIDDATAKAEDEGRAWRIAREDDTEFDLTDDLVEGRVTFEVDDGRVTWAAVEGSIQEGARNPDDRAYLGLDEDTMISRAEAEG